MSVTPTEPTGPTTPTTPTEPTGSGGPSGSPTDETAADLLAALQATLAAEHAAVFVLGALGGMTSASATPALSTAVTDAYAVHRTRRDQMHARIVALGGEPVAAEAGYALLRDLATPAAVSARALAVEEDAAATYAFLVASSTGVDRAWGTSALVDAAVRGLSFGASPVDLPGL